jgi:peroxin-1
LKAVSRKLTIASDVDYSDIAHKTEGFSGADLQALLYNAHLDVIHSVIAESPDVRSTSEEAPLEYVVISSPEPGKAVMTKAEERALERRVSTSL